MTYAKRTIEQFIIKASRQFSVLLVSGPRQVGKTTVLRHLSGEERQYVTLDDPSLAALAREEPALFLQRWRPPVLIDEIQYAPQLLPHIKMLVDEKRQPGMFWLTGSQQFQLMQGVSETLAGRVGIVNLLGLSLREHWGQADDCELFLPVRSWLEKRSKTSPVLELDDVYNLIWRGSFPAMWLKDAGDGSGDGYGGGYGFGAGHGSGASDGSGYGDDRDKLKPGTVDRDLFYSSYVQTYLQRDVRDLANVGDEGAFLKFLRTAAARTGQMLNLSDMARDAGVSVPTAKRWLSVLETSGIVYLLEPYHNNLSKRLTKTPKLYFLDTGLGTYLTEWSSARTLEAGAMSGYMLETFVVSEILKSYWHNGKRAPLYYYRDKDKREIDLLITRDDTLYPVECKKSAAPNKESVRSFKALAAFGKPVGAGGVICLAKTLLPLTDMDNIIPVGML